MKNLVLCILITCAAVAFAETSKTGTIKGTVTEKATKKPAIGATVVINSPTMAGETTVITDEKGAFTAPNLPPATYQITYYYDNATFTRTNVVVKPGATATVSDAIEPPPPNKQDVIEITGGLIETFTITGKNFTLKRGDDLTLTLERKGKPTIKAKPTTIAGGIELADGTQILPNDRLDGSYDIKGPKGKAIATLFYTDDGNPQLQMAGKKKRVSFNEKGVLVGAATKMTLKPARVAHELDTMVAVAALLSDKI